MKKKIMCFFVMLFAIILLTGCNNQNKSVKSIEDTKLKWNLLLLK